MNRLLTFFTLLLCGVAQNGQGQCVIPDSCNAAAPEVFSSCDSIFHVTGYPDTTLLEDFRRCPPFGAAALTLNEGVGADSAFFQGDSLLLPFGWHGAVSSGDTLATHTLYIPDSTGCPLWSANLILLADTNVNGICDPDDVAGCTDPAACNYDATATLDDGSCESTSCAGCTDVAACNYDDTATLDDGSCESTSCAGCTDTAACNYDDTATLDDGSCESTSCAGCTDTAACNYDDTATLDDGSCQSPIDLFGVNYLDCDSLCINDADGDGVCDEVEVEGCMDESANNYDAAATDDNGSCTGCTNPMADNYYGGADVDDGTCIISGCTDTEACNYSSEANTDDGSCSYPDPALPYDCNGDCINDGNEDGICDEFDGCTAENACNYDPNALADDGSCVFANDPCETCNPDGTVNPNDDDGDGVCNEDETVGCTDTDACNAGDFTDTDNSLCEYPVDVNNGITNLDCDGECYNDADGDGVCDEDEIPGCTDELANNYNAAATDDNGSCTGCTNPIADNYYEGADVDDNTCIISGCTDTEACNYFSEANTDDGSCLYPSDLYGIDYVDCDENCLNDVDGDGVCDEDEEAGCTDPDACNAGNFTDTDNSLCTYPTGYPNNIVDCDDNCLNDTDGDGVCDEEEIEGCQEEAACNYDSTATDADTCQYPMDLFGVDYLDCDSLCLNDIDGDGVCDEVEVEGCMDESACNFNVDATDDVGCLESSCLWGIQFIGPNLLMALDAEADAFQWYRILSDTLWVPVTEEDGVADGEQFVPAEGFADCQEATASFGVESWSIVNGIEQCRSRTQTCWDGTTTDCLFVVNTGENVRIEPPSLYPNPAHTVFMLDASRWRGPTVDCSVYTPSGKRVHGWEALNIHTLHSLDIRHLPQGLYIVQIHNGPFTHRIRLVKS